MGGGECVEEGGSDGGARVGREGEEAGTGALRAEAEGVGGGVSLRWVSGGVR